MLTKRVGLQSYQFTFSMTLVSLDGLGFLPASQGYGREVLG